MGKDSDKKRKRDSALAEDDLARPAKRSQPANDATDETAPSNREESKGGQARQKKSERRNKKALEAKQNGLQKREQASDTLASGQDYVSLNDDDAAVSKKSSERSKLPPQAATVPFQRKEDKVKKSSPRSMRKAAKAEKIAQALEDEGLAQPTAATSTNAVTTDPNESSSSASARFICFVGNLPYTATTAQIEAHFSKLAPKAVRHSTDKATGKSKGFAFLEFDSYDRMKTCLQSYHQSIFEPEKTAANGGEVRQATGLKRKTQGRKLNVELTAGGGGNTQDRKQKIREKNNKLKEERARKKLGEKQQMQEKLKKRREQSEKSKAKMGGRGATGANTETISDGRGDIHPSRLARVPVEV